MSIILGYNRIHAGNKDHNLPQKGNKVVTFCHGPKIERHFAHKGRMVAVNPGEASYRKTQPHKR